MRVALYIPHTPRGGSYEFLVRFFDYIQSHHSGHTWLIIASPSAKRVLADIAPHNFEFLDLKLSLPNIIYRLVLHLWGASRLTQRSQATVFFSPANALPLSIQIPTVVMFQNSAPFVKAAAGERRSLGWRIRLELLKRSILYSAASASSIIVISRYFLELLEKRLGRKLPAELIYHGVKAVPPWTPLRNEYRISYVSHFYPYKNHRSLIEAYAMIRNELPQPASLWLVGADFENQKAEFEKLITSLRVPSEEIVFTGALPHQQSMDVITQSSLFVFPSSAENCPTTLLEVMAMGVPIVCSECSPMPEMAEEYPIYVNPSNADSIAGGIRAAIATDWNSHKRQIALRAAMAKFPSPAQQSENVIKLLESWPKFTQDTDKQ